MRAVKHAGCVMNDRRKHPAECGAGESMYVHSEQRRNFQSKVFHEATVFPLLPPRPRSYGDTGPSSRRSELPGLQVQGLCCPLQQRPSSGRVTHRVTPQSRGGRDRSLTLLSSLKGRLESRGKPAPRSSTGSRPEISPEGGAPTVCHHTDPVSETAETPTTPCDKKRRAHHGHPSAAKVSELHLYLPSSLGDDEERDADRGDEPHETAAEETSTQESDVKLNDAKPGVSQFFNTPVRTSLTQDPALCSTPADGITPEHS